MSFLIGNLGLGLNIHRVLSPTYLLSFTWQAGECSDTGKTLETLRRTSVRMGQRAQGCLEANMC